MRIFTYLNLLDPLTLISIAVLVFFHFKIREIFRQSLKFSGHNPTTHPIIGCLFSFYRNRRRLLDWYTDFLSESETKTIVVQRLGATRTIVTANPNNVEYVLKTNFHNFPKGKPFTEILGDFLGSGIFNVDGELWHTQRKLASHEFTTNSLRDYVMYSLKEEVKGRLTPALDSLVTQNGLVDLQELLRNLAFDMICKVTLGFDPFCLDLDPNNKVVSPSSFCQAFDTASKICARRAAAPVYAIWKIKRALGIGSEKILKESVKEVHEAINQMILDRKKMMKGNEENAKNEDILSKLILADHEDKVVRDMAISFMMAGRDTTSAVMTWLFWLLSRHPNIEQDVLMEVDENSLMSYESIKRMKLLKACACETMRLYPPVPWDSKHAASDDVLPDGTAVRRGDRVTYFPYGMGRMETLWGNDRLEFKPDRWFVEPGKNSTLKKICPYKFPVFQAGPRVCIGKEMAFVQIIYVVASVLRQFEIEPVDLHEPVFVPFLTAQMAGGFKVMIRRRQT